MIEEIARHFDNNSPPCSFLPANLYTSSSFLRDDVYPSFWIGAEEKSESISRSTASNRDKLDIGWKGRGEREKMAENPA